jgi:hypothetical protein
MHDRAVNISPVMGLDCNAVFLFTRTGPIMDYEKLESLIIDMDDRLDMIYVKLQEAENKSRFDTYITSVLLGALAFLVLHMVP